jgi:hypothetical protein
MPDVKYSDKIHSIIPGIHDTVAAYMQYEEIPVFLEAGGKRRYFEFFMEMDFDKGRIRTGNEGQFFYESALSTRYENFYELKLKNNIFEKNNPWIDLYDEVANYIMNPKYGRITSSLSDSLRTLELYNGILNHLDVK